jgi:twitching motility protein PilT
VLRQDPDVVLVGEMRDLETISAGMTLAETGHLVFGTLHTTDAAQTVNRIVDMFPPHQQSQVVTQLSFVLRGIVAQQLIPLASGKGRILAQELLLVNSAVQNIIREKKIQQLYTIMQTGQNVGMTTFENSLKNLYQRGEISYEDAMRHSTKQDELARMLKD